MRSEIEDPNKFRRNFLLSKDQVNTFINGGRLEARIKKILEGNLNETSLIDDQDDIAGDIQETESDQDQIDRLKRQLEMERKAHQETKTKFERFANLFQKTRVTGRSFTYNQDIDSICLGLLSESFSAPQINTMLTTLAIQFPYLVRESEMFEAKVPSVDYIRKLRDSLPDLNEVQLETFLDRSEKLTLAVDGSSVSNSKKVTALSLINQVGETHSLNIVHADVSTGREICELMKTMIAESKHKEKIYQKLIALQSDLCPAQKLANNVFKSFVKTAYNIDIQIIPCCMHLTKVRNCDCK